MNSRIVVITALLLFILALAPWLISSCSPHPLLPPELWQARDYYEATRSASQEATRDAERRQESSFQVVPIGTLSADESTEGEAAASPEATQASSPLIVEEPSPTPGQTPTPTETLNTSSSVVIVGTTIVTVTPEITGTVLATRKIVVSSSDATPVAPIQPTSAPADASPTLGLPSGLIEAEDIITEAMLTEKLQQDPLAESLSDVQVDLTSDGVSVTGVIPIRLGLDRPIEAQGEFAVDGNHSLVVNVTSILFGEADLTEEYRSEVEERVNWSLYQLLPERYVQSYELTDGQVTVRSLKRGE